MPLDADCPAQYARIGMRPRAWSVSFLVALALAMTLIGCRKKKTEDRLATQLALGGAHSCAVMKDLSIRCWGDARGATKAPIPTRVVGRWMFRQVVTGRSHTCALVSDGSSESRVICWGGNAAGQCGAAPSKDDEREDILELDAVELAAGGDTTCARTKDGEVSCWGALAGTHVPTKVALAHAEQIAVGGGHACVRVTDGRALCWGDNAHGQLGTGNLTPSAAPLAVPGLANVARIATGNAHTCARIGDEKAMCWGKNDAGQLGDGTTTERPSPVQVGHIAGAVQLSLGGDTSCARMQDAAVMCWGRNAEHQLADSTTTDRPEAALVFGVFDVVETAVGAAHVCVRFKDARVRCWGGNTEGQVGDGTTLERGVPVDVKFPAAAP